MKAEYDNSRRRWQAIIDWYAEVAGKPDWEFLAPMVELTAWLAEQPFAAPLFPNMSLYSLCVQRHAGYNPGLPFVSCSVRKDGQFEFKLWASVDSDSDRRVVPLAQAREVFVEFIRRLLELGETL